jgi:hypothetical protein
MMAYSKSRVRSNEIATRNTLLDIKRAVGRRNKMRVVTQRNPLFYVLFTDGKPNRVQEEVSDGLSE